MRTFLGALMVLIVSGDETTIQGVLDDSVLLPCTCSESKKYFDWQMDEPKPMPVFIYNENDSSRYKGRIKTFLSENSTNCSILLTNITAEDQGKYSCRFKSEGVYYKSFVYLNVSANYSVCQTNNSVSGGLKVFQCKVIGRYREAWIQWTLHGQNLTNSKTINITNTTNTDAATGLYSFNSSLSTELNWNLTPMCEVKAKTISTTFISGCDGTKAAGTGNPQADRMRHRLRSLPPTRN
ncbi:butyrophilin subfamily 3 member A2 isoform X2 [Anoplopoma fimbria]|uniref:butyrophilin subfamily 3 member A2 isoform X2 n=1 Tax=Anoplopoma fimbria TaxID=229290 RepID=UPI0023EA8A40|nr:butyrophilin subfamily 3 member A2 isoform X2 [Anoplopoma fimbria]